MWSKEEQWKRILPLVTEFLISSPLILSSANQIDKIRQILMGKTKGSDWLMTLQKSLHIATPLIRFYFSGHP